MDVAFEINNNTDFYNDLYDKYHSLNRRNVSTNKDSKRSQNKSKQTINFNSRIAELKDTLPQGNFGMLIKLDYQRTMFDLKQRYKKNNLMEESSYNCHTGKSGLASSKALKSVEGNINTNRMIETDSKINEHDSHDNPSTILEESRRVSISNSKMHHITKNRHPKIKRLKIKSGSHHNINAIKPATPPILEAQKNTKLDNKVEPLKFLGNQLTNSFTPLPPIPKKNSNEFEAEKDKACLNQFKELSNDNKNDTLSLNQASKIQSNNDKLIESRQSNQSFPPLQLKNAIENEILIAPPINCDVQLKGSVTSKISDKISVENKFINKGSMSCDYKKIDEPVKIQSNDLKSSIKQLSHVNLIKSPHPANSAVRPVSVKRFFNIFGCLPICI